MLHNCVGLEYGNATVWPDTLIMHWHNWAIRQYAKVAAQVYTKWGVLHMNQHSTSKAALKLWLCCRKRPMGSPASEPAQQQYNGLNELWKPMEQILGP